MGDPMIEHEAAGFEDTEDLAEVPVEVANADVLEHADARDLVVLHVFRELEIIAELDAYAILQSTRCDLGRDEIVLILRQRDPGGLHTVILRCPENEPAPATPDVQKCLARLQAQLAADEIELLRLRLVQRIGLGFEVCA